MNSYERLLSLIAICFAIAFIASSIIIVRGIFRFLKRLYSPTIHKGKSIPTVKKEKSTLTTQNEKKKSIPTVQLFEEQKRLNYFQTMSDIGVKGEYLTYKELEKLPGVGRVLINLYIPKGSGTTEIDVLLVHETGLYVLESKNYGGIIFGDSGGANWTQCIGKKKYQFYNPIIQNENHIKYLKKVLVDIDERHFASVIVFSERCVLKVESESVEVVNRNNLRKTMLEQISKREKILEFDEIMDICYRLNSYINKTSQEKAEHIKKIKGIN